MSRRYPQLNECRQGSCLRCGQEGEIYFNESTLNPWECGPCRCTEGVHVYKLYSMDQDGGTRCAMSYPRARGLQIYEGCVEVCFNCKAERPFDTVFSGQSKPS